MNKLFFITSFLFLSLSCATIQKKVSHLNDDINSIFVSEPKIPTRYYDPELEAYVSEFRRDAEKYGVHISDEMFQLLRRVEWVDKLSSPSSDNVLAACIRFTHSASNTRWMVIEGLREKIVDFTEKNRISERELFYHELFHCLLSKGHLPNGVNGIMSPSFRKDNERAHVEWDALVEEMFSREFIEMIPDVNF